MNMHGTRERARPEYNDLLQRNTLTRRRRRRQCNTIRPFVSAAAAAVDARPVRPSVSVGNISEIAERVIRRDHQPADGPHGN